MVRFLKEIIDSERGQALPIVLCLLVLGGLLLAPTLSHAATSVNSVRTIERSVKALYAAEAGVKYGLLHLEPDTYPLTENINQMEVTVQVEKSNDYVLYFGVVIKGDEHSNWLSVASEIVWDEPAGYHKCTIRVTWQPNPGAPVIRLEKVGARLPIGYSYQSGSANSFAENLSTNDDELMQTLDTSGAWLLNWELESLPSVSEENQVRSQTFYIIGQGDLEDYYAWVVANRGDIGEASEITGILYRITATAICPESEEPTGEIVCEALEHEDGTIDIISWQVSK